MTEADRVAAVEASGSTLRQAHFPVLVLEHAGVCLPPSLRAALPGVHRRGRRPATWRPIARPGSAASAPRAARHFTSSYTISLNDAGPIVGSSHRWLGGSSEGKDESPARQCCVHIVVHLLTSR